MARRDAASRHGCAAGGASASLTVTDLTTVGLPSGLVLQKSVDKSSAEPGELLVYTIVYRNDGAAPITQLVIADVAPKYTTYVPASASCGALPGVEGVRSLVRSGARLDRRASARMRGVSMPNQPFYRGACFCKAVEIEAIGAPAVMAFCHCESCRTWLSAPVHGAALWPAADVQVRKGADQLGLYKKTEASHRQFCRRCGGRVLIGHPASGMIDVPSVVLPDLVFQPTMHVHYGEKVLAMRDGLPKFKDFPLEFGGSGDTLTE